MPAKTLTVTETAPFVELPSNWKCRVSCDGAELAREATHTIETLSMAYAHRASVKADPVAANTPSKPSELTEVHVALSGGSTPKVVYENFARTKFFRQMVDRHCALHFWYGDVRMVPDDSADSNAGMVLKALDGSVPPTHIHPVRVDLPAEEAARTYEAELRQAVDEDANGSGMPAFDILMLGMGGDGHCASLFPKTPAPDVRDRVCTTCTPPEGVKPAVERVTVTAPVIEAAKNVVLIVAGAEKRDALRGLLATDDSLAEHPDWLRPVTRLLRRCRGNVYLLVDKEAAAGLFSIANPCEDHDCKEQQQPQ